MNTSRDIMFVALWIACSVLSLSHAEEAVSGRPSFFDELNIDPSAVESSTETDVSLSVLDLAQVHRVLPTSASGIAVGVRVHGDGEAGVIDEIGGVATVGASADPQVIADAIQVVGNGEGEAASAVLAEPQGSGDSQSASGSVAGGVGLAEAAGAELSKSEYLPLGGGASGLVATEDGSVVTSTVESRQADVPLPEREYMPLGGRLFDEEDVKEASADAFAQAESGAWVMETLGALAIVLLVAFAIRTVAGMWQSQQISTSSRSLVEILTRTTIAPKTQVLLLRVNDRVLVVGHTGANVSTLSELTDPEEVAGVLGQIQASKTNSMSKSFSQVMKGLDGEYQSPLQLQQEGGDGAEQFVDRTRDQVSGLMSRIRALRTKGTEGASK